MRVLVADNFPEDGLVALRTAGLDVRYEPAVKGEALTAAVRDSAAEVLVVRGTEVRAEALRAGRLGLVVRAGAGYNTIDVKTASELGIYVSNCPGKNAIAVAELAMGLILSLDRQIPDAVADLRNAVWDKTRYSKASGLFGRTLGIVGMGSIGTELAGRARAFGMEVVAWSRSLTPESAQAKGVTALRSAVEVAARADVVSVHLALTPGMLGFANACFFLALLTIQVPVGILFDAIGAR